MSLSMRERLGLQKAIKKNLAALRSGDIGMRERLGLQKQIKADLSKLKAKAAAVKSTEKQSPFADLIAGRHNGLAVADFIEKLKEAYSQEDNLEKARNAVLVYYNSRQEEFADVA